MRAALIALASGIALSCSGAVSSRATTPEGAPELSGTVIGERIARTMLADVLPATPNGYWTPERGQAARLERSITSYLAEAAPEGSRLRAGLEEYRAQYFGIFRGDRELIYANCFCDDNGLDVTAQLVSVDDGGDCYFTVLFDPVTERFEELAIHQES